ncbi:putative C-S lyase [Bosea caraganae]|uniref:cysteine-S-conjugate beta-lyase n=1 Tax=Bosea caraganae TaxID=2763117 RepID=A0A370L2I6_9HYPH|nr:PatB family C-S lyase [Bosea caraganae]RDJ22409.1 putative C-S lyase [Bosea caraganae]RDJ30368.1 putative C-S lyase [Bosea caraganae]
MSAYDFTTAPDRLDTGSMKWSRYPADVLPMWVADMDFAVAPEIVSALRRRLDHPVFGYAVAQAALREQIVIDLETRFGWRIEPGDIVFLPGVEPGFNMALKARLSPGEKVLIQTPIYRPILDAPGHWGLGALAVPLVRGEQGYAPDRDALADGLAQARAFLLCNPHNPTGYVYTRDDLGFIAAACEAADTLIISDEIHCDLVFDGSPHVPIASLAPEIARRTITLMSASKTYNIPGLKTAFAVITDPALRNAFNGARSGLVDSVNLMGLEATLAAYRDAGPWRSAVLDYLQSNRDHLGRELQRLIPGIRYHPPEASFLAWLDCGALGLPHPQSFFLKNAKLGLYAGEAFGAEYGSFVRLNFGCTQAVLTNAVERMANALAGYGQD